MKVKLYFENEKAIAKSGIGKALEHQKKALILNQIDFTTNHQCTDYDLLHINTTMLNSYFEAKKAKKMNKTIVYHAHSTVEDFRNSFAFSNLLSPFYKQWLKCLYNFGDVIVTPTEYSKSILQSYGFKQPIYAISNGIDVERFEYDQRKVDAYKNFFQIKDQQKVIISVGWLFERKGFDTFCKVATQFPDITFIWFGDKTLSIPTANIREWIEHKPDNVILPGYIAGDIILGAYMGCDLFFFPSREETEGIVVLEALAAKAPVLVRDIGVYDGWLEDGVNCFKGKGTNDFVLFIKKFFNGEYDDLTEAGFQTAKQRGFEAIGRKLKETYEIALRIHNEKS